MAALASPRVIDFNDDGLLDLVVSAGEQIYLYRNIGTKADPQFQAHADPLPGRWTSTPLALVQMLDWNGDGLLDGSNGPNVYLNSGRGSPGVFESPISLLKPGQKIPHLSGMGDDWQFQRLFDLDADRRIDLLDADINGMIWWHRNQGAGMRRNSTRRACGFRKLKESRSKWVKDARASTNCRALRYLHRRRFRRRRSARPGRRRHVWQRPLVSPGKFRSASRV